MAQMSSNKCGICTECEGTVLCYECQYHLCDACRVWHDKFPATKQHTLVDSSQIDKVFSTTTLLCENHDSLFIHYCKKCRCLACARCVTSDHQSHPLSEVSEVSTQARSDVKEHIDGIVTKIKRLADLSDNIRSHRLKQDEEDNDKFTNDVTSTADEFRNMISSVSDMYITRASDNLVLRRQYFHNFLDKTDKLSEVCQQMQSKLERALTETHDVAFYVQYKGLNKEYEGLDEIPELEEPEGIGEFKEKEFTGSFVDTIQETFDLALVSSIQEKDKEILQLNNEKEEAKSLLNKRDKEVTELKKDLKNEKFRLWTLLQENENNEGYIRSSSGKIIVIVKNEIRYLYVSLSQKFDVLSVAVKTSDKIQKLKEMIETREGIPVHQQSLCLTEKRYQDLCNSHTFSYYGIRDGSCLELSRTCY